MPIAKALAELASKVCKILVIFDISPNLVLLNGKLYLTPRERAAALVFHHHFKNTSC